MARRAVFAGMRQLFSTVPTGRSKRATATFQSRAGETISLVNNKRGGGSGGYEKLNSASANQPSEPPPKASKSLGGKPPLPRVKESLSRATLATQPSSKPRTVAASERAPPMKRRSRVQTLVRKVRDSFSRFKEAARSSNLQLSDLFPGNQMLVHVTAMPVSRTKSAVKHYPSPGVGRRPVPAAASTSRSFRER